MGMISGIHIYVHITYKDCGDSKFEAFLFQDLLNHFRYIPFGSGRRICPGIGMAERLMPCMLASFLYSFNWRLPQGKVLDLKENFGLVLKVEPLVVVPTLRVR